MNRREPVSIIIRARREGVVLSARADGKLGWKANRTPSDELLIVLKLHREEILALIRPPSRISTAVGPARLMLWRVRALGFEAVLDGAGTLLISDATGRRRDVSRRLPIAEVFDTIVAGLADDPDLLDLDATTAEPDLSDLDPRPPDLADEPRLLNSEESQ